MAVTDFAERLRGASLWATKQRTAVLRAVDRRPHTDVDQVIRAVRAEIGRFRRRQSTASRPGLVRRIEPAGSPTRFALREADEAEVIFWGLCPVCAAAAEHPN